MLLHYCTARTDFDARTFVRNPQTGLFNDHYILDMDNRFSTPYGQRLAKIQAHERVGGYILAELEHLENNTPLTKDAAESGLLWTDSNTALTELIYSLHARGAINN